MCHLCVLHVYTCYNHGFVQMFKVVEFLETCEVELVPTFWVKDSQCCWPDSLRGMALHQAIKNSMAPDLSWDHWEVRTMFSTGRFDIFVSIQYTFCQIQRIAPHSTLVACSVSEKKKNLAVEPKYQQLQNQRILLPFISPILNYCCIHDHWLRYYIILWL